jgi:ArsR family transcriptional regulator
MNDLPQVPETEILEEMAELLRAIAHPVRLAIIELLLDGRQLSVSQIQSELKLTQATASHHLIILKNKDILDARRSGKSILYYLNSTEFGQIAHLCRIAAVREM